MVNLALLVLRLTLGSFLAGHGAQKLFGWFGGYGLQGTSGWLESMGLRPGRLWAIAAGGSEFGGGVLMLLGFLNPLGPLGAIASMGMATAKVHWGKPIWVTSGGAELPLTNIGIAAALGLAGPGSYSVDRALGTRLPRWVLLPGLALAAAGIGAGLWVSTQPQPAEPQPAAEALTPEEFPAPEVSGAALQAGEQAAHPV